MNDLRYALRGFARTPGFTLAAVFAAALGIGATTAVFGVLEAVLLSPLPYEDADRVVRVRNRWAGTPDAALSPAEFFDYLEGTRGVFSAFGGWSGGSVNVTGGGEPERVAAASVTWGVFAALSPVPVLGRVFDPAEDGPEAAAVVLSHDYWQRRFGGRRDVIGTTLRVNGAAATVIGVLSAAFRMPDDFGSTTPAELFLPLRLDRASAAAARGSHYIQAVARLAPGEPLQRAGGVISSVAARFVAAYPDDYPRDMRFGVRLSPVRDDVVGDVRPVLLVLMGAVGLVLLIACANVAGLMLTRAESRRRELAVRAALGAGRSRIARQLIVESLVLALLGGTLGVLLATWGTAGLTALRPQGIPRMQEVGVDALVLAFAAAVTVLTGLLFGLAPVLGWRKDGFRALRESGRGTTASRQRLRFRRGLIVAELALALVLLAGAGLLIRSFVGLLRVDPGFDARNVLTTRLTLPAARYPEDAARRAFYASLVERVRALPGVTAAGAVSALPLAMGLGDLNVHIEGRAPADGEVSPALDWQVITPGYFDAMRMRLVRGRDLGARDDERAPGAVVINETAARTLFPGVDAIGQRFTLGGGAGPGMVTVVGMVGDVRHSSLGTPPRGEMYIPHRQFTFWNGGAAVATLTLVLRTAGDPADYARAVRRQLAALDPELPAGPFLTMEEVAAQSVSNTRFIMLLLGAFAAIALLLATIGIYGIVSLTVSQRAHELGVRIALGARAGQVIGLVLRQGLVLVALGTAIGVAASLAVTRTLAALLYDVAPRDGLTLATVAATLAAAAVLACLVPARRATRADPMAALRAE